MKGCARTCTLQLLGWAAASAAFYLYLRRIGDLGPGLYWASVGGGLCVMLSLGYLVGIQGMLSERSILREATAGTPLPDGKWVAVSGHIHSMSPLRGPFTGEDVVAYQYKISRMERHGKSSSDVTYYEGKALMPSTISTRAGSVRLLSVPTFDMPAATYSRYQDAVANAREYLATTQFETSAKDRMEKEQTDDDGNYRFDRRAYPDREIDVDGFQLQEFHVQQNATVCAFGLYSQQRGGLIPHPNWSKQTRLMLGDAENVAAQLTKRMRKYAIGVVFFAAAAYGVVWIYSANAPQ